MCCPLESTPASTIYRLAQSTHTDTQTHAERQSVPQFLVPGSTHFALPILTQLGRYTQPTARWYTYIRPFTLLASSPAPPRASSAIMSHANQSNESFRRKIARSQENTIPLGRPCTSGAPSHTCTRRRKQAGLRTELGTVVTSPMSHKRARKQAGGAPGWDVLPWKAIEPPLEVRPKGRATPNNNSRWKQPCKAATGSSSAAAEPSRFSCSLAYLAASSLDCALAVPQRSGRC